MILFDSHCHPQFSEYDNDRDEMLGRAFDNGVFMIAVGSSPEASLDALALAKKYSKKIWATVGIHPSEETGRKIDDKRLSELAELPEVVAIGECGLDYYHLPSDSVRSSAIKTLQRKNFIAHIGIAKTVSKPLILHCRNAPPAESLQTRHAAGQAYADMLNTLKEHAKGLSGVIHFFGGTAEEALEFLNLGFFVSFAGPITFTDEYRDVVTAIPLERILAETDAPYAAPVPYRGKRNEPSHVAFVIEKIAEIKRETFNAVAKHTAENTKRLFGIS